MNAALLTIGDEIKVKVLKIDRDNVRVSLGLKQLGGDPWLDISQRYPVGSKISGRVTDDRGNALGGISLSLNGSANMTTDGNGNYSFANVAAGGNYTVTPSSSMANSSPPKRATVSIVRTQRSSLRDISISN